MAEDWPQRFLKELERKRIKDADACRIAGVEGTTIADIRRGGKPSLDKMALLAPVVGWSLNKLYHNTEEPNRELSLTGVSEGSEMWAELPAKKARTIGLDLFDHPLVAIEIRGDDIGGYDRGDVVAGEKTLGNHIDNLIGAECIIESADGKKLLKILQRGTASGRYNLHSLKGKGAPIENVKISWAAPVQVVFKKTL